MSDPAAWALFTRLGEAQILLPAMAAALLWLALSARTRALALAWAGLGALAAAATTASKIAFIGFGVGSAALDYTGISGHAMFAALVLPVLARIAVGSAPAPWPRAAIGAGFALALLVGVSRVVTGAHSASEVVFGLALGGAASAWALRGTPAPQTPTPRWIAAGLAAWLAALPFAAPPSHSHDLVTRVALDLSGRSTPFHRHHLHRQVPLPQAALTSLPSVQHRPSAGELQLQPLRQRQLGSDGVR